MFIKDALDRATNKLNKAKINTASLDAEVLLAFILKKSKEYLYTYPEKELTQNQLKKFNQLIARRTKGEPVAYLRNLKEFYGLEFYVDKNVLIPRPETELLVEQACKLASGKRQAIADVGVGSGAIAISLAKNLPDAKIIGTEISKPALKVAQKNAKIHKVKIKFYQGDLLEPLKNIKVDVIVANLPYGDKKDWPKTSPTANSLKFEPKVALYAENSGLGLYEKLFCQIADLKFPPKQILIEIDPNQARKAGSLVRKYLPNYSFQIKKDLSGLKRLLIISRS